MAEIIPASLKKRGNIYKEVTSFESGFSNDGLYGIDTGTKKFQRIRKGTMDLDEAGISAGGSDQTANLNFVYGNAKIHEIIWSIDGGGVVTINGTVDCQGKVLTFRRGTRVTGTGTITNAVLDIPYNSDIFASSVKFENCHIAKDYLSVKWFGAIGDGNSYPLSTKYGSLGAAQAVYPFVTSLSHTIDYAAIQAAINYAIKIETTPFIGKPEVVIPAGKYRINKGIVCTRRAGDGTGAFFNLSVRGGIHAFGEERGETIIQCDHVDGFGFGIQKGKGVTFKNVYGMGSNTGLYAYTELQSLQDQSATFVTNGVVDNVTKPYAFFVIDPFGSSAILSANRYPGYEDLYTETSPAGSSDIKIEGCKAQLFVNGISVSVNDITQNGDGIIIDRCWIDYCKNAITNGSSQNRSLWVTKLKCWGVTKHVFNCADYGTGTGAFPEVDGVDIAGSVRWLVKGSTFFSMASFKNVYAELLYGIGGNFNGTTNQYNFEHCTIHFAGSYPGFTRGAAAVFQGGQADFVGCQLYYYYAAPQLMYMNCPRVTMRGCKMNAPLLSGAVYQNLEYGGDYMNSTDYTPDVGGPDALNNGLVTVLRGQGYEVRGYQTSEFKRRYDGGDLQQFPGIGATVTIDEAAQTYTFDAGGDAARFKIGDKLVIYGGSIVDEFGVSHIIPAGIVQSKSGTVITASGLTFGMVTGTLYAIYNYRIPVLSAFHIGNITAGSNNITGVIKEGFSPSVITLPVGTTINHPYFPAGTYIVSKSGSTITVSNAATSDEAGAVIMPNLWHAELFSSNPGANVDTFGFLPGDRVKNNYTNPANNNIQVWVCTKAGIVGNATYPPTFMAVYADNQANVDTLTLNNVNGSYDLPSGYSTSKIQMTANANLTGGVNVGTGGSTDDNMGNYPMAASYPVQITTNVVGPQTIYFSGIAGTGAVVTIKIKKEALL